MVPFSIVNGSAISRKWRTRSITDRLSFARVTASPIARSKSLCCDQLGEIGRQAVLPRVALGELGIGHDQRHQMRLAVAVDDRLADLRLQRQDALRPAAAPRCRRRR